MFVHRLGWCAAGLLILMGAGGCGHDVQQKGERQSGKYSSVSIREARKKLDTVKIGMKYADVINIMGNPQSHAKLNNVRVIILYWDIGRARKTGERESYFLPGFDVVEWYCAVYIRDNVVISKTIGQKEDD